MRATFESWRMQRLRGKMGEQILSQLSGSGSSISPDSCGPVTVTGSLDGVWYNYAFAVGDEEDNYFGGSIGSGVRGDGYNHISFAAKCCIKKPCCNRGQVYGTARCKVHITWRDKYSFDNYILRIAGVPFWTTVHFYSDFFFDGVRMPCR